MRIDKLDDPDAELVRRAGGGDSAACAALVDRHLNRLLALAVRMLGNRADAEDVAQETFLRVWQRAANWRANEAQFSTWLYRVALNLCHDRLRQRRPQVDVDEVPDLAAEDMSAERESQRGNVAAAVAAALMGLPERQREAIVLCYYQELGNIEAARVLDVSVEALESLLSRARRALRETLRSRAEDLIGEVP